MPTNSVVKEQLFPRVLQSKHIGICTGILAQPVLESDRAFCVTATVHCLHALRTWVGPFQISSIQIKRHVCHIRSQARSLLFLTRLPERWYSVPSEINTQPDCSPPYSPWPSGCAAPLLVRAPDGPDPVSDSCKHRSSFRRCEMIKTAYDWPLTCPQTLRVSRTWPCCDVSPGGAFGV